MEDPFVATPQASYAQRESHRYSSFDNHLLTLNSSSPTQLKLALEAHLAETERRLLDTSKLGTSLVQQQKELEQQLKEVERQQAEGEIGPELRHKLAGLEKEFNEVGRESARVSLGPKPRFLAPDETPSLDGRSPGTLSSQATNSPSKVSVPSRRQRNQPSSRVHDIEFATEISTSLLAQVRQLQALLAERDETLRALNTEKSRLELESEGLTQRIRALDESEQRYKDENWGLETQSHELQAAAKEAAERATRLTGNLHTITQEKTNIQRELDELKQANGRLIEEHATVQKANDSEIHMLRRNLNTGDTERSTLQKKVDELVGQNQELAKAIAQQLRNQESEPTRNLNQDKDSTRDHDETPENSPPPSPNKATPRHGHLESETLKSSLHHAHRMIQNLKNNIHREKTEKIELKRMLQDARDELETRRNDSSHGSASKRPKTKPEVFKKPLRPAMLGAERKGLREIEVEEPDWEDEAVEPSPTKAPQFGKKSISPYRPPQTESASASDVYQTADETEDAFETANERETATESEAFQTGAESLAAESSDELTETESRADPQATLRGTRQKLRNAKAGDRTSFISTASTSADEMDYNEMHTPVQSQPQRYKVRMQRGRRVRTSEDESMFVDGGRSVEDSPASMHSPKPLVQGQSLFAELGELGSPGGSDSEFGTPLRSNTFAEPSTPVQTRRFGQQKQVSVSVTMVDTGMMTEPLPSPVIPLKESSGTQTITLQTADASISTEAPILPDVEAPVTPMKAEVVDSATQYTPIQTQKMAQSDTIVMFDTPPRTIWDEPQVVHSDLTKPPSMSQLLPPVQLEVSQIFSEQTIPVSPATVIAPPKIQMQLALSTIASEESLPVSPPVVPLPIPVVTPRKDPVQLRLSTIAFEESLPISPPAIPLPAPIEKPTLVISPIQTAITKPIPPPVVPLPVPVEKPVVTPALVLSPIQTAITKPIPPPVVPLPVPVETTLVLSPIQTAITKPIAPPVVTKVEPPPMQLELSSLFFEETTPVQPTLRPSMITGIVGTPINGIPSSKDSPERPKTAVRSEGTRRDPPMFKLPFEPTNPDDDVFSTSPAPLAVAVVEQAAQTTLTSEQIDSLLMEKRVSRPPLTPDAKQATILLGTPPISPSATPKAKAQPTPLTTGSIGDSFLHPHSAPRRPGSSGSQYRTASFPPLPSDHKRAIAAAAQRLSAENSANMMGPPLAPASAYRSSILAGPRTPSDGNGLTPKTKYRRSSQVSRRSSVSSWASELDERFNISTSGYPFEPGTEPRMIQAITETMIGEFLWKYTRKPGRPELSNSRHRRYFWVHPYTCTLYWSTHSPQAVGRAQSKSKGVAIEAVRVVTDDNPYPPGLHRKSLEIVTPGRVLKFTASTSQRHETWLNALSYLLLRTSGEDANPGGAIMTPSDANDSLYGRTSRQAESRRSISSQNSRNARAISRQYLEGSMVSRHHNIQTPSLKSPSLSSQQGSAHASEQAARQGSVSRFGNMFKNSGVMGTFSSRRSRYDNKTRSIDSGSAASHDSAEDLRRVIERQDREADKLENVRACCDGKHDVGSLSRTSRYSSRLSHHPHT
ncbi:hypothetical protein FQN57_006586 [Myotisia sp. PD_48]|nr:hypothetical protein FQN57_006586 [Myotisia sp. PD_48]